MEKSGAGAGERNSEATFVRLAASAGSGKTFALALRFLACLLTEGSGRVDAAPDWGSLLAVTFTNKAAGEMRFRILSWLKGLAGLKLVAGWDQAKFEAELIEVRRVLTTKYEMNDASIRAAAQNAVAKLFYDYDVFQVSTLDSFLTRLASGAALEVGLPPGGEVVIGADRLTSEVFSEFLESAGEANGRELDLDDLIDTLYLVNPGTWWDPGSELMNAVKALRSLRVKEAKDFTVTGSAESLKEVRRKAVGAAERLIEEMSSLPVDYTVVKTLVGQLRSFAESGRYADLKSKNFGKTTLTESMKNAVKPEVTEEMEKAWRRFRESVSMCVLATVLLHSNPMVRVLNLIEKRLDEKLAGEGRYLLERLPFVFSRFFDGGGVPSVYFYWGERLRRFLVDEFQDTNRAQWNVLRPLVEEALSIGGSLFVVGDVKQAIFRFRGGNSHLFRKIDEELPSAVLSDPVLENNYRSGRVLTDFFADVFSRSNLEEWSDWAGKNKDGKESRNEAIRIARESMDAVAGEFREAAQNPAREGGYVQIEAVDIDSELGNTDEAREFLAREIVQNRMPELRARGWAWSDIAFLVRKNEHVELITSVLLDSGYPVAAGSTLSLSGSDVIRQVFVLLAFLNSPPDDFAFATFVGGSVFRRKTGFSAKDFADFAARAGKREHGSPLYVFFREYRNDLWKKWLEPLFRGVGRLPPYDLLQEILRLYRVRGNFPGHEVYLYRLLECARELEEEAMGSIGDLVRLWNDPLEKDRFVVPLPEGADAVRVSTIHKAKGLGFPVVVLPFPYLETKLSRWSLMELQNGDFTPVQFAEKERTWNTDLACLHSREVSESLLEELHVFYVALTRASDELYLYLPTREKESGRLLHSKLQVPVRIPDEGVVSYGEKRARVRPEQSKTAPAKARPEPDGSWFEYLRVEENDDLFPSMESRAAAARGTMIHAVLEHAATGKAEVAGIVESLGGGPGEAEDIHELISRLRGSDLTAPFVEPGGEIEVRNELPLIDEEGRLHVVDRLLIGRDRLTIIDWKTGAPEPEKHSGQVRTYCRLLSSIYPDRKLRAVLVYVDLLDVVEVPWPG